MPDKKFHIFATADIGEAGVKRLRERGYEIEVYPNPEPPPKSLIIEKVRSGIDGLITTLRDPIDADIFEAGKGTLRIVASTQLGSTTSTAMRRTTTGFPSPILPMSSPKRQRSSPSSHWRTWRANYGPPNIWCARTSGAIGIPTCRFSAMR